MFPEIEPIIQGDALAILNLVSNTGLQERYVAKSDKLIELKKEKALAWQLKEKSDLLWNKISKNAINQGEYRYKNAAQDL